MQCVAFGAQLAATNDEQKARSRPELANSIEILDAVADVGIAALTAEAVGVMARAFDVLFGHSAYHLARFAAAGGLP